MAQLGQQAVPHSRQPRRTAGSLCNSAHSQVGVMASLLDLRGCPPCGGRDSGPPPREGRAGPRRNSSSSGPTRARMSKQDSRPPRTGCSPGDRRYTEPRSHSGIEPSWTLLLRVPLLMKHSKKRAMNLNKLKINGSWLQPEMFHGLSETFTSHYLAGVYRPNAL